MSDQLRISRGLWILLTLWTAMFSCYADLGEKGEAVPELVDGFGNPHDFKIEGAKEIQPQEIKDALIHSILIHSS